MTVIRSLYIFSSDKYKNIEEDLPRIDIKHGMYTVLLDEGLFLAPIGSQHQKIFGPIPPVEVLSMYHPFSGISLLWHKAVEASQIIASQSACKTPGFSSRLRHAMKG